MITEIITVLACVPLFVINSFCDKYVSAKENTKQTTVLYNVLKFFICALLLLPLYISDGNFEFEAGAVLCGIVCGIMYAISKTVILKGYEKTSVAFMTFCHAAGMIIPCIIAHFLWQEHLSFFSIMGILTVVLSIVLIKDDKAEKGNIEIKGIIIGLIIFLTSGGVMVVQKIMGIYFALESVTAYNLYSFITAFLILCFFIKPKNNTRKDSKHLILPALGSAVSLCVISLVMTKVSGAIPSVIMFPLFNGLGIILVCICSVFAFKEKFTVKKSIGLILGIIGLCMINI